MNGIDHTYWYLSRAAGLVAYLLLFVTVCLGLSLTGGTLERILRRYRVYDMHRFVSLVALGATLFHVVIVLPDQYMNFNVLDLAVPFVAAYRPLSMALGIASLYLTGVIIAAFYARRVIGYRGWRLVHYATFAAFALALAHGIGAGSDSSAPWVQYTYAATGLLAFNLLVYRALYGAARAGKARDFPSRPAVTQA